MPMTDDENTASILKAIDTLTENVGLSRQLTALDIASEAGVEPAEAVKVLQSLGNEGRITFYRSGGGDPAHSFVTVEAEPSEGS